MPSTPPERIRAARERAGLELSDMADQLGLPFAHYCDLEDFEDEAWTTISIATLQKLARILRLTPLTILEGEKVIQPSRRLSFADFSAAVAASVREAGGDAEAWGDNAGWDVGPILEDPEEVWNLDADGLRDIAEAAGVDWRSVLPD